MSSFDRRIFLISAVALVGCGFTPAYGPGATGAKLRGHVEIEAPEDREDYNLASQLALSFGRVQTPLYRLSYDVTTKEHQIGLTRDQEILRYHVEGTVTYSLTEIESGRVLLTKSLSQFTGYSVTSSAVDRLTASRDAYARLMRILSDQMVGQIIALVELET